jgi:hypothetical protein
MQKTNAILKIQLKRIIESINKNDLKSVTRVWKITENDYVFAVIIE